MNQINDHAELVSPYGGELVDLMTSEHTREERLAEALELPSVQLSIRQAFDLELLALGGFSPLNRFMGEADFRSVLETMRLENGVLFPIPITLPIEERYEFHLEGKVALRSPTNDLLALMTVEEVFSWDPVETGKQVFGTTDPRHPLVAEMNRWGPIQISGELEVLNLPLHYDFKDLRLSPAQSRSRLSEMGKSNVVAFQTRNPLHRVHEELVKRAMEEVDGNLLLHPVVGSTKPGDVDHYIRVRTYKSLTNRHFDRQNVLLALLPLAMRLAGPREALLHAIIRRNYGANFHIIGRDHASPGLNSQGEPFYDPYEAQDLVERLSEETGVKVVPFRELVFLPGEDRFEETDRVAEGTKTATLSGTEIRSEYLDKGRALPDWYIRREVAQILADSYPPRSKQGICIWFTGLSGSGKSTTANVLSVLLRENGRTPTVLDGDVIRTHLSKGLGFGREDRDINIRRIGFVASEIVRHDGTVVCAAISPYRATRNDVRNLVGSKNFVEVFMDTPLEICESRDAKGLYARARRGELKGFTGIDDPYEAPTNADIVLETTVRTPEQNAQQVMRYLEDNGFVGEEIQ